ncbi:MAG: hypothetical protein LUD00_11510 [Prevotellaceae bacterium]|nr:hypothetical protein [Prevotellaceae bacterium]
MIRLMFYTAKLIVQENTDEKILRQKLGEMNNSRLYSVFKTKNSRQRSLLQTKRKISEPPEHPTESPERSNDFQKQKWIPELSNENNNH